MNVLLLATALFGCGEPVQGLWLEGFGFEWQYFNHRLSHFEVGLQQESVSAAVIGGTSTTAVVSDLPEGCDEEFCQEFPFLDNALVQARWARTETRDAAFGEGTASLVVDSVGASTTIEVPLSGRTGSEIAAIIVGLNVDTDQGFVAEDSCYASVQGWHPRRIAVDVSSVTLLEDKETASVEVTAAFEAGLSLEEERACIDEVAGSATAAVLVDVLVVSGKEAEQHVIAHSLAYEAGNTPLSPAEQPEPDLSQRALDTSIEDALVGFGAMDFAFHQTETDGRGAYLRSWSLGASSVEGWASGHASNYSPGTQLSGFDYTFEGRVEVLAVGAPVERGVVSASLPAELDEEGLPVVSELGL